jgi:hypothetical protein
MLFGLENVSITTLSAEIPMRKIDVYSTMWTLNISILENYNKFKN